MEEVQGTSRQKALLSQVISDFDVTSVRLRSEVEMEKKLQEDEDLSERFSTLCEEASENMIAHRLALLTDCYRCDPNLTPRLHRVGQALSHSLRLVQPLDIYIQNHWQLNGFCTHSRKGRRLVMCLNSGLVERLKELELLFVMGHEAAHALFGHTSKPTGLIDFDNPNFSALEVVRLRTLDRRRELSCDRVGLLACQNLRAASSALFKLVSGLSENWVTFDEATYGRVFDEIGKTGEFVDLEDAAATHPIVPLRVRALLEFANSEVHAKAFGLPKSELKDSDLENRVEYMLSLLDPDLGDLLTADEQDAAGRFVLNGALVVAGADGVVQPSEVSWLKAHFKSFHPEKNFETELVQPDFRKSTLEGLEKEAYVLRNKLSETRRAGLLRALCEVATAAGGLAHSEVDTLVELAKLLDLPPELFNQVLGGVVEEAEAEPDEGQAQKKARPSETSQPPSPAATADIADMLETIVSRVSLPDERLAVVKDACNETCAEASSCEAAVRDLVARVAMSYGHGAPLTETQAKKLIISAAEVFHSLKVAAGSKAVGKTLKIVEQIRRFGVVSLFTKGETVTYGEGQDVVIESVSRTKGVLLVRAEDGSEEPWWVQPNEVYKDPEGGIWAEEFTW